MKGVKTFLNRRVISAFAAAALVAQCVLSPLSVQTVHADTTEQTIERLVTQYSPTITQTTSASSGLVHPGVGLTKELLDNVQAQVRSGGEPWTTYFEDMLVSASASKTPQIALSNPTGTVYNSQGTNGLFRSDALTAYTQAVLYYVTGDNVYRKNALDILRAWSQLDPTKYAYFTDACIHVGIPMNRMCIAAEIIRYSSYQVTDGYADADLNWAEGEINDFIHNLVSPAVNTFMSSHDEFMNQHLYTTIGAMSAYLFMDDVEGYAKTVEWFTVNKDGANPGFNGSIERLFRKTTTIDEVGGTEGSGTPLREAGYDVDYVIQHVEMGRDQAHGCGDLTNAAILSRLMLGQGTKVDPEDGTISTAADAVTCYEFLDDRILEAANFFFQYMLGYDAQWVPVPYSIRDTDGDGVKEIVDFYREFAPGYRGRYQTINFWDLYAYYTYVDHSKDLQNDYPYFYEGFMKKMPSNYMWNGGLGINWDNVDGGGDFWLFLPAQAAADADTLWLAPEQTDYLVEVETRGSMVDNQEAMEVLEDSGVKFVRFSQSASESRLAIHSGGVGNQTIAFRIRTDGAAKLSLENGVKGSINLPDTNGEWQYVTFTRNETDGFGDLYYVILSDIQGSYVDLDSIDIKPTEANAARTVDILHFAAGDEDLEVVSFAGAPISLSFEATDRLSGQSITYSGTDLPTGASIDAATGAFAWTPSTAGTYQFYISAKANATVIVKKVTVTVVADRVAAVANAISAYDENEIYISATLEHFLQVLSQTQAMISSATDEEFAAQLNLLSAAVKGLELVSPILEPDTISTGGSLDYTKMVYSSTTSELNALADSDASFCGYYTALTGSDGMKEHILDFGPDFRISLTKVGYKARLGFPDRLAGVHILGSNDGVNWTQLTVSEAQFNQAYHEVAIKTEEQSNKYRYLKIYKSHNYPEALRGDSGSLLEFSEFRMWGTRYEIGNKIESISMSSDAAVSQRIKMGDTVKLLIKAREQIRDIQASIQGISATVVPGTEENTWIASAVMASGCATGDVKITLDYTKSDGTAGERFYSTTDGSSLFLVNSDIYIDTAMLAETLTATSGSWDNALTADQCAALLFDKDVTTFGDLKNATGDYYTVDFGEGVSVRLSEVIFMPRSTAANHASRLNGAIVSGSNDGVNWTQITPAVSGATMNQWAQITEGTLLDNGAYRYFKISGAEQGDIAEVEFYGTYVANPELIAGKITTMADQEPSQTRLIYPSIPEGYTVSIKTSSNEEVVALDGTIHTPQADTTVTLVLTVTHVASGNSADTAPLEVTIKGIGSLITGIAMPAREATCLTLPQVPEGFVVSVETSSDQGVVSLGEGRITTPAKTTIVNVSLKLVRTADNATVLSDVYPVLIYGSTESAKIDTVAFATVTASNNYNLCGNIFDGNVDTFADTDNGVYYTIDFGEGTPVIVDKVRIYPRSDSNDTNAQRTNGAQLYGSNNGTDWIAITEPVTGTRKSTWIEIPAEQFVSYGSFRYFKVSGATRGSMAELELYGVMDTSAEVVASKITAIADVTATQSEVELPSVPAGYTVRILGTSHPAVIAMDGTVSIPSEDVDVLLTLEVSGNGNSATTGQITVHVQGMAGLVSKLSMPAAEASTLVLPEVPTGFSLTIAESSDHTVIETSGAIHTPQEDTLVDITLRLTRTSDGAVITLAPQRIMVYGTERNTAISILEDATIESTNDPYPSGYTKQSIAALLVDGDTATFGDLKGNNGRYLIDFGEGSSVILDKVRLYPRSTHVSRLTGTYVQGSVDGNTWVDITPVVEATTATWYEFSAEQFLAYGAFRYFMIAGGTGGNVAEVEFYGAAHLADLSADEAAIAAAEAAVREAVEDVILQQNETTTELSAKSRIEAILSALALDGVEVVVTTAGTGFESALAGTALDEDGRDGSYSFTVTFSRGIAEPVVTEVLSVVIRAQVYEEEDASENETVSGGDAIDDEVEAPTVSGGDIPGGDTQNPGEETEEAPANPIEEEVPAVPTTPVNTGNSGRNTSTVKETVLNWNVVRSSILTKIAEIATKLGMADDRSEVNENVDFAAGTQTLVPNSILEMIKGKTVTIAFHSRIGVALSISGQDLKDAETNALQEIDLTIDNDAQNIPDSLIEEKHASKTKQISLKDTGSFEFTVNMHVALGEEHAGKFANLYRYNEESGQLEYCGSFRIVECGNAVFALDCGGEYLVTVTETKANERVRYTGVGYTVEKGDSLSKIAGKYHLTLAQLLRLNPQILDSSKIRPGQKIRLK